LFQDLKERDHTTDLGIDGIIILTPVLKKQGVKFWSGFNWLSAAPSSGYLGFLKRSEKFHYLSKYQFFDKDCPIELVTFY
jgi:hypothetical protein